MPPYDFYERFRDSELNEDEQKIMDSFVRRIYNFDPRQKPVWLPEDRTMAHRQIALRRADRQFRNNPIMPEDEEIGIRFPSIDPVGKYSLIDMKFAQREAVIQGALQSREYEVRRYVRGLLESCQYAGAEMDRQGLFNGVFQRMKEKARTCQYSARAAKLCLDADGREELYREAREAETSQEVVQCDMMFQGIEYAVGVRTGPVPEEIRTFYRDVLKTELNLDLISRSQETSQEVQQLTVEFENLDHKLLQRAFANPHNWGLPRSELEKIAKQNLDLMDTTLPPYAAATLDRMVSPIFDRAERSTSGICSRGDLIIIDGKTVRETMEEKFAASGRQGSFEDFYRQNAKQMTNELMAAGLMAGKRVEAFLPDARGRIPKEPAQITRRGYEPSPLEPEKFSRWQRFFAKRGFFKEKAARQAEYDKAMAARERVQEKAAQTVRASRLAAINGVVRRNEALSALRNKELFFGTIMDEMSLTQSNMVRMEPDGQGAEKKVYNWDALGGHLTSQYGATGAFREIGRSEGVDTCVCLLAAQGHKFADIMDPNKLQAERLAAAREFIAHARNNDQEWLGRTFYAGHKAILQQAREMTQGLDLRNEEQLLAVLPQVEAITHVGFGASQTLSAEGCREAYVQAAIAECGGNAAQGRERAELLDSMINRTSFTASKLYAGVSAQAALAAPERANDEMSNMTRLQELATARLVLDHMRSGESIIEQSFPVPTVNYFNACTGMAMMSDQGSAALRSITAPENRAMVSDLAADGRLFGELSCRVDKTSEELYAVEDQNMTFGGADMACKLSLDLAKAAKTDPQKRPELPEAQTEAFLLRRDIRQPEPKRVPPPGIFAL